MVNEEGEELPRQLVDWTALPDEVVLGRELRAVLDRAVATLPHTLRTVFVLRDIEGLSTAEVAEALSLTETNVKVRLASRSLVLREQLTAYFAASTDVVGHNDGDGKHHQEHMPVQCCKDTLGILSEYVDGELDTNLCEEIERHMAECGNCRVMVDTLRKTIILYRGLWA